MIKYNSTYIKRLTKDLEKYILNVSLGVLLDRNLLDV